jgi:ferredoxin-nitrite reductase
VFRQKQAGLNYVGLAVPVGRITSEQMLEVAALAENYGTGQLRLTVGQNIIVPNVPDGKIGELTNEPVLQELRYDPSEVMRGLVSCTGMDYCHFALIETKGWALKTAQKLESKLGKTQPLRMHWSGCPAGAAITRRLRSGSSARTSSSMVKSPRQWMCSPGALQALSQIFQSSSWKTCRARI